MQLSAARTFMKNVFLIGLMLAGTIAQAQNWKIDPVHSSAQFSVKHMMIMNVKGDFKKVTGSAVYDPKNLNAASLEASIETSTISTREEKRDTHLKSADFLDVAKFPTITFKSTKFEKAGDGLKISGNLTMRGVTKPVILLVDGPTVEIKDTYGNQRVGATATTKVNRKDFGIVYNAVLEAGGVVVGDDVAISLDVELIKQK